VLSKALQMPRKGRKFGYGGRGPPRSQKTLGTIHEPGPVRMTVVRGRLVKQPLVPRLATVRLLFSFLLDLLAVLLIGIGGGILSEEGPVSTFPIL
jgi:hypothetical protein